MAGYFSSEARILQGRALNPTVVSTALKGKKYVLVYFSASWCPPCRAFTPKLRAFYDAHHESKNFEVVFVSLDRSAEELKAYMNGSHGDWLAIPHDDAQTMGSEWMNQYGYNSIPSLLLLEHQPSEDRFRPIVKCARSMVVSDPDAKDFPWRDADAKMEVYYRGLRLKLLGVVVAAVMIWFLAMIWR